MLKNRSGAPGRKKGFMAEPLQSPTKHRHAVTDSAASGGLFSLPRTLSAVLSHGVPSEPDAGALTMSPTSILDAKQHLGSSCASPLSSLASRRPSWECANGDVPEPVGLGLVDALARDEAMAGEGYSPDSGRMLRFSTRLRVLVPPVNAEPGPPAAGMSPRTPIEFGLKNKDSFLAMLSPVRRSPLVRYRSLPATEMELSEDYTCVIAHGPNPRTTHIYDDCVVETESAGEATVISNGVHSDEPDEEEEDDGVVFMPRASSSPSSCSCNSAELFIADDGPTERQQKF